MKVYSSSNFRHAFPQAILFSFLLCSAHASEGKLCSVTATIEYKIILIEKITLYYPTSMSSIICNGMTIPLQSPDKTSSPIIEVLQIVMDEKYATISPFYKEEQIFVYTFVVQIKITTESHDGWADQEARDYIKRESIMSSNWKDRILNTRYSDVRAI